MSPPSNSAKAMQHSRARPSVPKAIVPAIPLPYIQKRKQQEVAREKAKEDAPATPVIEQQYSTTPPPTVAEPAVANGSSVGHDDNKLMQASKETSKETSKGTSSAPEQVQAVVNSVQGEPREVASKESVAQSEESIPGTMNSLYFEMNFKLIP